jgi:hypothetical protein
MLSRRHQELVDALQRDKNHISQSLHTLEAPGLLVIVRAPGAGKRQLSPGRRKDENGHANLQAVVIERGGGNIRPEETSTAPSTMGTHLASGVRRRGPRPWEKRR